MSVIILSGIISRSAAFFKCTGGSALWLNRGKKKEEEEKGIRRNKGPLIKPSRQPPARAAADLFSAPYVDWWVSRRMYGCCVAPTPLGWAQRDFGSLHDHSLASWPRCIKVVMGMCRVSIWASPCKQQIHTGTNVYKCAWRFNPTWTGVNSHPLYRQLLGLIYESCRGTWIFMGTSNE